MRRRRTLIAVVAVAILCPLAALVYFVRSDQDPDTPSPEVQRSYEAFRRQYSGTMETNPDRTVVTDHFGNKVATLTVGARTVLFNGPERTFSEPSTTTAKIVTRDWVWISPQPWPGGEITPTWAGWLSNRLKFKGDDVLATAVQYSDGVADQANAQEVNYIGDAGFGFINSGGVRDGADFNDYLGIPWTYPDKQRVEPAPKWSRELDCSGYLRLVYGYRHGMVLHRTNGVFVDGLPRSTWAIAGHAPSVVVASGPRMDEPPADLTKLQAGDLVFFALHDDRPGDLSHSGIYLGLDTKGDRRFISSRATADGPTFGDHGGKGVLNAGFFAPKFRRAIRL